MAASTSDNHSRVGSIETLMNSSEFSEALALVEHLPGSGRSLLSPVARALMFALVRAVRPEHAIEIGTFRGGTAEVVATALKANGRGTLHTVGPFDARHFREFYDAWPEPLRSRVTFYECSSMPFFMTAKEKNIRAGVILVDGNHDYEYALFDICSAARFVTPGGYILVDNVSQAGPYFAVVDFLSINPGWVECASDTARRDSTKAFDRERRGIPHTDLMILRAPSAPSVLARPTTWGETQWHQNSVRGVKVVAGPHNAGVLQVQCVLRGFSPAAQPEAVAEASIRLDGVESEFVAQFATPLTVSAGCDSYRVEPWLVWDGAVPLKWRELPTVE